MKGTKYYHHNIRTESCLFDLIVNCIDFEEENTLLQSKVLEMCDRESQFFLYRSPKFNCELAGEGIEYTWGCENNYDSRYEKSKE